MIKEMDFVVVTTPKGALLYWDYLSRVRAAQFVIGFLILVLIIALIWWLIDLTRNKHD